MGTRYLTTEEEIRDFVRGTVLFAVGGGGPAKAGYDALMEQLALGNRIGWVDVSEMPDDAYAITGYGNSNSGIGTGFNTPDDVKAAMEQAGVRDEEAMPRHVQVAKASLAYEEYLGKPIEYYLVLEPGGRNSGCEIATAAMNGKTVLDCDLCGRAVPEITQCKPILVGGLQTTPCALCDAFGDTLLFTHSASPQMTERFERSLGQAAFLGIGVAAFCMTGAQTKAWTEHGTMSLSYDVGRLIRETREAGGDPVQSVVRAVDGWVLGIGTCVKKSVEAKNGWTVGSYTFDGTDGFEGNRYEVTFQNENHIVFRNGEGWVTSPDMIMYMDAVTGEPYTTSNLEEGFRVAILGKKAPDYFRTEAGVASFRTQIAAAGHDYVPIEELV